MSKEVLRYEGELASELDLVAHILAVLPAVDEPETVRHPLPPHKFENVMGYLPEELKEQTQVTMRAAFWLPAKEDMTRLEKQAQWLEGEYPERRSLPHAVDSTAVPAPRVWP